ncbi:MAG: PTS sugar transporter subunit IIB [Clostridiaceae bacterium]
MTFLAVCSFGVGSSLILKLSLDKAIARLGVSGEAFNIDISSARGTPCDAVFTSPEIAEELKTSLKVPVYGVRRYMDVNEVTAAVQKYLEEHSQP